MKLISPTIIVAVTLFSVSAAFADDAVRRIDHPNGQPTYVTAPGEGRGVLSPDSRGDRGATIGVYAGDRSFGGREEVRADAGLGDVQGRVLVPIHLGRGQTIYTWVQR